MFLRSPFLFVIRFVRKITKKLICSLEPIALWILSQRTVSKNQIEISRLLQGILPKKKQQTSPEHLSMLKALRDRRPGFSCPMCNSMNKNNLGFVEVTPQVLLSGIPAKCDQCGLLFNLGQDKDTTAAITQVKRWLPELRKKEAEVEMAKSPYRQGS